MAERHSNSGQERRGPVEEAQQAFEQAEGRMADAMERLVRRESFGELLALMTDNAMALTRIGTGIFDLAIRNLRLAGRQDLTNLGRQLARTEDKLERVLQEVERLQEQVNGREEEAAQADGGEGGTGSTGSGSRSGDRSGGGGQSSAGTR